MINPADIAVDGHIDCSFIVFIVFDQHAIDIGAVFICDDAAVAIFKTVMTPVYRDVAFRLRRNGKRQKNSGDDRDFRFHAKTPSSKPVTTSRTSTPFRLRASFSDAWTSRITFAWSGRIGQSKQLRNKGQEGSRVSASDRGVES